MRKFYIIPVILITLFSCRQTELEFSCDPAINTYISENRAELSQITIQELTSYDPELQKAIFNSWDYLKKRSSWLEKFRYILAHENFSETETVHIQKLINHIEKDYFMDESVQNGAEARSLFASRWISYATKDLGWPEQYIAFMVYRLYTNYSQFESELSVLKSLNTSMITNSEGSCDCNVSADFCGTVDCRSGGCSSSSSGCGWLWQKSCDGLCY